MTLRIRSLIGVGITLVGLILILSLASRTVLLDSYARLEDQSVRRDVERVLNALSGEIDELDRTTGDYARWDDTYAFIEDGNQEYLTDNYADVTFVENSLSLVILANAEGRVIFSKAFDRDAE